MKYMVLAIVACLGMAGAAQAQTYRELYAACEKDSQPAVARIKACDQALAAAQPDATADRAVFLLSRSIAHLGARHVSEAIADADESARILKRYQPSQNMRCWIRAINNTDLVVARQACREALNIQNQDPGVQDTSATLALQEGDWQFAWDGFDFAFKRGVPSAVYGRGLAALALGKADAEADLQRGAAAKADFDSYGLTQASVKARAAAAPAASPAN